MTGVAFHRRMAAVPGNSGAVVAGLAEEGVPRERLGLIYNGVEFSLDAWVASYERLYAALGEDRGRPVSAMLGGD